MLPPKTAAPAASATPATPVQPLARRRQRLQDAALTTATKLQPLVELLDAIQPHVASESVFHTRRLKLNAHLAVAYEQARAERPNYRALLRTIRTMGALVREEKRDISRDELKQAAREFVLATLKNAPAIISAAHQARLLA